MATTKRPAYPKGFSPVGIAVFPSLNRPDTKFKPDGEYKVKLKVTEEEAQPLIDKVTAMADEHFQAVKEDLTAQLAAATDGKKKAALKKALADLKLADISITDDVDDEGEPNGFKLLNFKTPSSYKSKKDLDTEGNPKVIPIKITIADAKGKTLAKPPAIWGGSKLCVSYELRPFYTDKAGVGISLRLTGAQIIELQSGNGGGVAFGAREGYEQEDEDDSGTSAPAKNEDAPQAGDDDF